MPINKTVFLLLASISLYIVQIKLRFTRPSFVGRSNFRFISPLRNCFLPRRQAGAISEKICETLIYLYLLILILPFFSLYFKQKSPEKLGAKMLEILEFYLDRFSFGYFLNFKQFSFFEGKCRGNNFVRKTFNFNV